MLLQRAMRYYRLWIYTCNVVLMMSVMIFVVTAAVTLSDVRFRFVPLRLSHPTLLYAYLALAAQGGVLQAVGCIAARRLSERLLQFYWLGLMLLLFGDLLIGAAWVFLFGDLSRTLPTYLWSRFQADYGRDAPFTAAWDQLQRQAQCCGVHGPRDYNGSRWALLLHAATVPDSCCYVADAAAANVSAAAVECPFSGLPRIMLARRGCAAALRAWLQHCADVLFVLGYCVIAFLKLCFLGILRYEIKEMIQKIKLMHGDAPAFPELAALQNHLDRVNDDDAKVRANGNNNELELKELPPNIS